MYEPLITPIVLVFDGHIIIHKGKCTAAKMQNGLIDLDKDNENKFDTKCRI